MGNALNCILASLLGLHLSVLLANRRSNGKERELIMQYRWIVYRSLLLRILSSLQIAFCTVVYAMGCMGMSYYDASHMEYGSMSHGATALVAFPPSSSMFLPLVFLYLILLRSSVSPVTIDYRSLPMSFRFLLKPSMPARIPILSVVHLK